MELKNSGERRIDGNPVNKLVFVMVLFLLGFISLGYSHCVMASELKSDFSSSDNLSKEDEKLIDRFLDETLGLDPAIIAAEKKQRDSVKPSTASGFSLYTGYGVVKNVLKSNWLNLNSNNLYTTADYYYSSRRNRINNLDFYIFLDNTHYADLDVESDKREFYTRAQGKFWVTDTNALGAGFSYLNQLSFDADNAVEYEPIPKYKNEEYIVTPFWEKDLGGDIFFNTQLEYLYKRTLISVDDFDRFKLIALLKKVYGRGSEIRLTLDTDRSFYDEGEILDPEGYALEDTRLRTESQSLVFFNSHYWSGGSGINLKSRVVLMTQKDNGPGYYDYNYYYLAETFQFQLAEWKLVLSVRFSEYLYPERKISSATNDSEEIYNSLFEIDLKLEKKFGDDLLMKIETVSLQSSSNDLSLDYTSDSILCGLIWFF